MSSRLIFKRTEKGGQKEELYGSEDGDLEIYVDGAWGISVSSTVVKINFFTVAPNIEVDLQRRDVAVRLAMPVEVFFSLRDFLDTQCKKLIEKGIVKIEDTKDEKPRPKAQTRKKKKQS